MWAAIPMLRILDRSRAITQTSSSASRLSFWIGKYKNPRGKPVAGGPAGSLIVRPLGEGGELRLCHRSKLHDQGGAHTDHAGLRGQHEPLIRLNLHRDS